MDHPRLTGVEGREPTRQALVGFAADQRSHGRLDRRGGADLDALNGIDELAPEPGRVIDITDEHGEACGRALLAAVAESRTHQIGDGEVDVGVGCDDQGVLAAGFGKESHVRFPRSEQVCRVACAGQNHSVGLDDQVSSDVVVGHPNELQHIVGNPCSPAGLGHDLRASRRLRSRLEHDGVACSQAREHSAGWDRDGEVPRRHNCNHADRFESEPAMLVEFRGAVGVPACEVDGFGDLAVGLDEGLVRLIDHGVDEVVSPACELVGGTMEDALAIGGAALSPPRLAVSHPIQNLGQSLDRRRHRRRNRPMVRHHHLGDPLTIRWQVGVGFGLVDEALPRHIGGRRSVESILGSPRPLAHRVSS